MSVDEAIESLLARPLRGRNALSGRSNMAYWLVKTEPDAWSWDSR